MIVLSANELTVLELTAKGKTGPQIAKQLNYSLHAIKSNKKLIMSKLEAKNMTNAVAIAIRKNII